MFAEFTEIVTDRMASYAGKPKERPISINPEKIASFFTESNSTNTILNMRKENVKVAQPYEEVKAIIEKIKN